MNLLSGPQNRVSLPNKVQTSAGLSRLSVALEIESPIILQRWLMADFGFTERGAQTFMGQAAEYEVANVVDPNFTMVAKIPKSLLPRR